MNYRSKHKEMREHVLYNLKLTSLNSIKEILKRKHLEYYSGKILTFKTGIQE